MSFKLTFQLAHFCLSIANLSTYNEEDGEKMDEKNDDDGDEFGKMMAMIIILECLIRLKINGCMAADTYCTTVTS